MLPTIKGIATITGAVIATVGLYQVVQMIHENDTKSWEQYIVAERRKHQPTTTEIII
jgi:hypothetical protein